MTTPTIRFNHPEYSDDILYESISDILGANTLLSLSNIRKTEQGLQSWIATAFYAFNNTFDLYILTPPDTQHVKNLFYSKLVAVAIFDSHQEPTQRKQGLQILGTCNQASGMKLLEGYKLYGSRFVWLPDVIKRPEDFAKGIIQSKIYVIRPTEIKIFDEPRFGEEIWVTVSINK